MSRAALQIYLDVTSAVPARRRVIQRCLRLELLDGIGVGQRHVVQDWQVYVVRVNAFQLEIVVSGTLSVDVNRHLSPSERRGVKQFSVGAGGEGEKRKKIPCGKWKGAGRLRANRFAGGCGGEFNGYDHIVYGDGMRCVANSKSRSHARCFRHLDKNLFKKVSRKPLCHDFDAVSSRRQAGNIK